LQQYYYYYYNNNNNNNNSNNNRYHNAWGQKLFLLGRPAFDSRQGLVIFLFTVAVSRQASGPTGPPIQWETGALPRQCSGRVVKPPSIAEVKNVWSYPFISPYVFMTWCLVKYKIRLRGVILNEAQELYLTLLSLCLTKSHPMKAYPLIKNHVVKSHWGSGDIAPRINLDTRWR
jgi:hypothetical protein